MLGGGRTGTFCAVQRCPSQELRFLELLLVRDRGSQKHPEVIRSSNLEYGGGDKYAPKITSLLIRSAVQKKELVGIHRLSSALESEIGLFYASS